MGNTSISEIQNYPRDVNRISQTSISYETKTIKYLICRNTHKCVNRCLFSGNMLDWWINQNSENDASPGTLQCLGFWFGVAWFSLATFTESVTEATTHNLQVSATAGTSGLPAFSLFWPVVCGKRFERKEKLEFVEALPISTWDLRVVTSSNVANLYKKPPKGLKRGFFSKFAIV